jgi:hypothetical protein
MDEAVRQGRRHLKNRCPILLPISGSPNVPGIRQFIVSKTNCCAIPWMAGGARLISSRKRIPFPVRGKKSGGNQPMAFSLGTGSPLRSVGESWLNRRSIKSNSFSVAT